MQTHDRPVLTCTRARQTQTHHNPCPHQNLPDITAGYLDQQLLMSGLSFTMGFSEPKRKRPLFLLESERYKRERKTACIYKHGKQRKGSLDT